MSNKRFVHAPTEKAYTIIDTEKGEAFEWEGGYSETLMHERALNQFPNEEYCPKCFKRQWQGSSIPCDCK